MSAPPSSLPAIAEIEKNFDLLDEWEDRYRYVIELGGMLAPLSETEHSAANKVRGCASQVWMVSQVSPDGADGPRVAFRGDSDAHIVRGLIAILLAQYSGRAAGPAGPFDPAALQRSCLDGRAHPRRRQACASGCLRRILRRLIAIDARSIISGSPVLQPPAKAAQRSGFAD